MDPEIPSPDSLIDATFGEGGYLSRAMSGYRPRAGQIAFSRAVLEAIQGGKHLLAEAGTGIGKSMGYSVPASYMAATRRRPVIIVTANIALQEQIYFKDLPLLASAVPWRFSFSMLKGRNNYLCRDALRQYQANRAANRYDGRSPSPDEKRHLDVVYEWAKGADNFEIETQGDKSELSQEPPPNVWRHFSVTSKDCKGTKCKYSQECFPNAALSKARNADVIVTNYHLLFAHIDVLRESGFDLILPPFEIAILDEAHKAPDVARDAFGITPITREAVKRFGQLVRNEFSDFFGENSYEVIDQQSTLFFSMLTTMAADRRRYNGRVTGDFTPEEREAHAQLSEALSTARQVLADQQEKIQIEYEDAARVFGKKSDQAVKIGDRLHKIEKGIERGNEIMSSMNRMMRAWEDHEHVYFLEEDKERRQISIRSKLIAPGSILHDHLFRRVTCPPPRQGEIESGGGKPTVVIACSATLATSGGFSFIAGEMGVPANYNHLVAASPFDYQKNCLFVTPRMPEPNDERFEKEVIRMIEKIILLADGRTLCLFTSYRMLNAAVDGVAALCRQQKIRLLKQGDAPRTKLVEEFKKDVRSVLFGTESLWAGVDVPGEACSVVVIDKFPFVSPSDPVLSALSINDNNTFQSYSVPRAIMAIKQGFGRLIRTETDRGIVVLLDQRITTKNYGRQFRISLPLCSTSESVDVIPAWLNPKPPPAWDD